MLLGGGKDIDETVIFIDRAIKEIWIKEIREDLKNNYILYEDTLKNVFIFICEIS